MKAKRLLQFTVLVGLLLVPSLEVESFHEPENTLVFPQLVVGQLGDLSYFPVFRACSPDPIEGQIAVFEDDRSSPPDLLINGQTYQGPVPVNLDANECDTFEMSLGGQAGTSLQGTGRPFATAYVVLDGLGGLGCPSEALNHSHLPARRPLFSTRPAVHTTGQSDIALSFFYNVRDPQGRLVDSVAVPPSSAGRGFRFVTSRGNGFDVGVAAFVTTPNSTVNITVYLPEEGTGNSVAQGTNTLTGSVQILGKTAFFLHQVIPNFPETVSAALVEMELAGSGQIYGVALGVQAEGENVQLSGQNVIPLQ